MWIRRTKLRASSVAPMSSRTAKAASRTRRPSRSRRARSPRKPPAVAPSPPRSDSIRLNRAPRSAGASPDESAANSDAATVNATIGRSIATSSRRGKSRAASTGASPTRNQASASPSAPPIADSSRLSVSSWRVSRPRLAPIAARTVSSRCRARPRDRQRLATFAHAISSTQATPAARTSSAARTREVISSTMPRTCTTGGPPMPNNRFAAIGRMVDRAAAVPSASACAGLMPGRNRATAQNTLIRPR